MGVNVYYIWVIFLANLFCKSLVDCVVKDFGKIDILINNAGVQFPQESIEDISQDQLELTYKICIVLTIRF